MQHIEVMLNAFNGYGSAIQLRLKPLGLEFSAVSPIMSNEAWLLCQVQVERFA